VPPTIRRVLRTRRIADALTRRPSLRSSPRIRWYPQLWFSVASRSTAISWRSTSSSTFLEVGERLSRSSQLQSQAKIR